MKILIGLLIAAQIATGLYVLRLTEQLHSARYWIFLQDAQIEMDMYEKICDMSKSKGEICTAVHDGFSVWLRYYKKHHEVM